MMRKLLIPVIFSTVGLLLQITWFGGMAQAQTLSKKFCVQPGEYVVMTQRLLPGLLVQDHIFFCKNTAIVDNIGFGPSGRITFSVAALNAGRDSDGSCLDAFVPSDAILYNVNFFKIILGTNGLVPVSGCQYGSGATSCSGWMQKIRNAYWFQGEWTGTGYTCTAQSSRVQKVSITISQNAQNQAEVVATKIDGDPCVPAGNVTFRGPLPDSVAAGTKFNVTHTLGYPNKPASTSAKKILNIIDANAFNMGGINFVRNR